MALQAVGMANQNVPIFEPNYETNFISSQFAAVPIVNNGETSIPLDELNLYVTPDKFSWVSVDFGFVFECNNAPNPGVESLIFVITGTGDFGDAKNIVQYDSTTWDLINGEGFYYAHVTGIMLIGPNVAPIPNDWISMVIKRKGNGANNIGLIGFSCKSKLLDRYLDDADPQAVGLGSNKINLVSK